MQNALRLLLPALIPSWRFFDVIAPSPRIEYALGATSTDHGHATEELAYIAKLRAGGTPGSFVPTSGAKRDTIR